MSVITQMTLYGVYDLRYLRKGEAELRRPKSAAAAAPSVASTYKAASAPFYLKNILWGRSVAAPADGSKADAYKNQVASVFVASRQLAEQSEQFVAEKWPKLKIADNGIVHGQADPGAVQAEYDVRVAALAKQHTFISKPLWLDREDLSDNGVYAIALTRNDRREKAIFYLDKQDNARGVLKKAADAINTFSGMAKARVLEEGGAVRLLVAAGNSGAAGRFSLYDDTGGLLGKLGMELWEQGSDGLAVIDGKSYTLSDNSLKIDGGHLALDFLRAGQGNIKVLPDAATAEAAVDSLFQTYNNFRRLFNQAGNKTGRANDMLKAFDRIFQDKVVTVPGLWQESDGCIEIPAGSDCLSFAQNIAAGRGGLADVLHNMASGVLKHPINNYLSTFAANHLPSEFNGLLLDIVA